MCNNSVRRQPWPVLEQQCFAVRMQLQQSMVGKYIRYWNTCTRASERRSLSHAMHYCFMLNNSSVCTVAINLLLNLAHHNAVVTDFCFNDILFSHQLQCIGWLKWWIYNEILMWKREEIHIIQFLIRTRSSLSWSQLSKRFNNIITVYSMLLDQSQSLHGSGRYPLLPLKSPHACMYPLHGLHVESFNVYNLHATVPHQ